MTDGKAVKIRRNRSLDSYSESDEGINDGNAMF